MTARNKLTEAVEKMQESAEGVGQEFTGPGDDWTMVAVAHPADPNAQGLVIGFDPAMRKDQTVIALRQLIEQADIEAFTMVVSTWISHIERKDYDPNNITRPSEDPNREERLLIFGANADEQIATFSTITRDGTNPPTLGPWEDFPTDGMTGRFITPFVDALKIARRHREETTT